MRHIWELCRDLLPQLTSMAPEWAGTGVTKSSHSLGQINDATFLMDVGREQKVISTSGCQDWRKIDLNKEKSRIM